MTVSVRFSESELSRLREYALLYDTSLSDVIRESTMKVVDDALKALKKNGQTDGHTHLFLDFKKPRWMHRPEKNRQSAIRQLFWRMEIPRRELQLLAVIEDDVVTILVLEIRHRSKVYDD